MRINRVPRRLRRAQFFSIFDSALSRKLEAKWPFPEDESRLA
jgi:hypothetical protein